MKTEKTLKTGKNQEQNDLQDIGIYIKRWNKTLDGTV